MDHEIVKEFVCHQKGHLEVPSICPPTLTNQLIQCWEYNPNDRPKFETLWNLDFSKVYFYLIPDACSRESSI